MQWAEVEVFPYKKKEERCIRLRDPFGTFKHLHVLKTRCLFFLTLIAAVNIYHSIAAIHSRASLHSQW